MAVSFPEKPKHFACKVCERREKPLGARIRAANGSGAVTLTGNEREGGKILLRELRHDFHVDVLETGEAGSDAASQIASYPHSSIARATSSVFSKTVARWSFD
jgi:hypothetical protein